MGGLDFVNTLLSISVRFLVCVLVSPFLFGVIAKTKALFAGRKGSPLLQLYYDILKLLQKGNVYSLTTTWIFRASPVISLSAVLAASLLIPFGSLKATSVSLARVPNSNPN